MSFRTKMKSIWPEFGKIGGGHFMKKTYLALTLAFSVVTGSMAENGEEAKLSASAEHTAKSKRAEILAEIQTNKDGWAGEYYAGDGLGVNTSIVIAPKSGYVFEWHGCLGLYDRNYGAVNWSGGKIRLSFTFENDRQGLHGIAAELVPVAWGSRHYLIPAEDIVGFCNSVNQGREPRNGSYGSYLLRVGDEKKRVTGFPQVPDEYRAYLLKKPVKATIVAVGAYTTRPSIVDWKFKDTPVTLDVGSAQGIRKDMELVVVKPLGTDSVRITKVADTTSEALMSQAGEEQPGPKVGWQLSTQAPWNVQH